MWSCAMSPNTQVSKCRNKVTILKINKKKRYLTMRETLVFQVKIVVGEAKAVSCMNDTVSFDFFRRGENIKK